MNVTKTHYYFSLLQFVETAFSGHRQRASHFCPLHHYTQSALVFLVPKIKMLLPYIHLALPVHRLSDNLEEPKHYLPRPV